MSTVVANRYARALADVIGASGDYRTILTELESFFAAYRESLELREVCDTPAIDMAKKLSVVKAIGGKMGLSKLTLNFLQVLMSHYRFPLLAQVVQAFRNVAYARMGIVRVSISSATPLSIAERQLLQGKFSQLTHMQSQLEFHHDPDLIGGVVAQIGSTIYDGSIRGSLERIRERVTEQEGASGFRLATGDRQNIACFGAEPDKLLVGANRRVRKP
jgi:F-type H+-transporting ATPase subunit delta